LDEVPHIEKFLEKIYGEKHATCSPWHSDWMHEEPGSSEEDEENDQKAVEVPESKCNGKPIL
jgi:hypothetical protein